MARVEAAVGIALLAATVPGLCQSEGPGARSFERKYTATAHISVLSIPLFSRSGVGFGFAGAEEKIQGERELFGLRFLSGTIPERAHGLNRFGFIQENVEQKNRLVVSANYFGLITANGEESLSEAKAAIEAQHGEKAPFVAAKAVIRDGLVRYSIRHMLLPSSYRGTNADQLLRQVEAQFAIPQPGETEKTEAFNGRSIATFLYSLRQAIQARGEVFDDRFVYNGKTFRLHAEKRADPKVGAELAQAHVTASADRVMLLNANMRNERTNEVTNFRLWFEKDAGNFLPVRFEYKARSYLRLVFTAEPPTR